MKYLKGNSMYQKAADQNPTPKISPAPMLYQQPQNILAWASVLI
jgi:hypothetical protein